MGIDGIGREGFILISHVKHADEEHRLSAHWHLELHILWEIFLPILQLSMEDRPFGVIQLRSTGQILAGDNVPY